MRALALVPSPEIFHDSVKEKSQVALARVWQIVGCWQGAIGAKNLRDSNVPQSAGKPFEISPQNLAEQKQQEAALWAKILPLVLLLWALTGAFYPAIDLCAGEKERGTLETLLCSPAQRSEIVAGKLGAVMLFSMATSILNLLSMGVTSWLVVRGPDWAALATKPSRGISAACRRSRGCCWRSCRPRPCSVRCVWRWQCSRAAPRKGNTI